MALKRNASYVAVLLLMCILILVVEVQFSQAAKLEDNPSYKECVNRCSQEMKERGGYNPRSNECEEYCKGRDEPM
ncbi:hypothetical protein MKW92_031971, partial [Papaver armeniacum]